MVQLNKSFWAGFLCGVALIAVFGTGFTAGVAKIKSDQARAQAEKAQQAYDQIAHHSL